MWRLSPGRELRWFAETESVPPVEENVAVELEDGPAVEAEAEAEAEWVPSPVDESVAEFDEAQDAELLEACAADEMIELASLADVSELDAVETDPVEAVAELDETAAVAEAPMLDVGAASNTQKPVS